MKDNITITNLPQKLVSMDQLEQLKEGDKIHKYPAAGKPQKTFDPDRKQDIVTYKIRSINKQDGTLRLVVVEETLEIFTWPGDIGHLDIRKPGMLTEAVWWIA